MNKWCSLTQGLCPNQGDCPLASYVETSEQVKKDKEAKAEKPTEQWEAEPCECPIPKD